MARALAEMDEGTLIKMYCKERKNIRDIASAFYVSVDTVQRRVRRLGIYENRRKLNGEKVYGTNGSNKVRIRICDCNKYDLEWIKKLYLEGCRVPEISDRSGIHEQSIRKLLMREGLYKKRDYVPRNKEADQIIRMHVEEGKSANQIARELHLYPMYVRNKLIEAGVYERCKANEKKELDSELLRKMHVEEGKSASRIAIELKTSARIVKNALMEMGIYRKLRQHKKRIDIDDGLIKKMRVEDKLSFREIGNKLGISHETIRDRLTEIGVHQAVNKVRLDVSDEKLKEMYDSGMMPMEIADEVGMSLSGIVHRLTKMGAYRKRWTKEHAEDNLHGVNE